MLYFREDKLLCSYFFRHRLLNDCRKNNSSNYLPRRSLAVGRRQKRVQKVVECTTDVCCVFWIPYVKASATRFGKILPKWQNFNCLGHVFQPTLAIFCSIVEMLQMANLWKRILPSELLTSCLTGLDLNKLVNLYLSIKQKQSDWILTSQTGGQLYSDTSSYKVSECSLI